MDRCLACGVRRDAPEALRRCEVTHRGSGHHWASQIEAMVAPFVHRALASQLPPKAY